MIHRTDDDIVNLARIPGDDELLLLSVCREGHKKGPSLRVDDLTYEQFNAYFQFKRDYIHRLQCALHIPSHFVCPNGTRTSGNEGLYIFYVA